MKKVRWKICYQSKVGRMQWLEPDTEDMIKKYSKRPIVLVPIAFVSEHSETLVELDIEYGAFAKHFFRVLLKSQDYRTILLAIFSKKFA